LRKKPIIDEKQKSQIVDLILKIIGDSFQGRITRLAAAGVIVAGAQYMPDSQNPNPQKETVKTTRPVE